MPCKVTDKIRKCRDSSGGFLLRGTYLHRVRRHVPLRLFLRQASTSTIQLTDGGPSVTPELRTGVAGPPFDAVLLLNEAAARGGGFRA